MQNTTKDTLYHRPIKIGMGNVNNISCLFTVIIYYNIR